MVFCIIDIDIVSNIILQHLFVNGTHLLVSFSFVYPVLWSYLTCVVFVSLALIPGRSLMVKKNDGIKESTDSSTTIEDEDTRGKYSLLETKEHFVFMSSIIFHLCSLSQLSNSSCVFSLPIKVLWWAKLTGVRVKKIMLCKMGTCFQKGLDLHFWNVFDCPQIWDAYISLMWSQYPVDSLFLDMKQI